MKTIPNKYRGVTLLELMIVLAILAVIVTIAMPGYQNVLVKERRAEGKSLATQILAQQERYYTENNTYTTDMSDFGYPIAGATSENGFYRITAGVGGTCTPAASCVILTITPLGAQATNDTFCGVLTVNTRGEEGATGTAGVDTCW